MLAVGREPAYRFDHQGKVEIYAEQSRDNT
jgi:hypothetical protein